MTLTTAEDRCVSAVPARPASGQPIARLNELLPWNIPDGRCPLIDDPEEVGRLLAAIRAALPLPARMTPRLLATVLEQNPGAPPAAACRITRIDYAGDEGGIVCHLARDGADDGGKLIITSITHLAFDPGLRLARGIAAYQKRRTKRLRRLHQP